MEIADFVVVGSSGGGGTIAWLLAKAGLNVVVIEAGSDIAKPVVEGKEDYNPVTHDEFKYRLERPDPKRRLRGDYNTIRQSEATAAAPFDAAWTASVLGGGSIIWGTWAFRALPVDFRLRTHFHKTGQLAELDGMGYSIPDWPIQYSEMEPFYNVAAAVLGGLTVSCATPAGISAVSLPVPRSLAWVVLIPTMTRSTAEAPGAAVCFVGS